MSTAFMGVQRLEVAKKALFNRGDGSPFVVSDSVLYHLTWESDLLERQNSDVMYVTGGQGELWTWDEEASRGLFWRVYGPVRHASVIPCRDFCWGHPLFARSIRFWGPVLIRAAKEFGEYAMFDESTTVLTAKPGYLFRYQIGGCINEIVVFKIN